MADPSTFLDGLEIIPPTVIEFDGKRYCISDDLNYWTKESTGERDAETRIMDTITLHDPQWAGGANPNRAAVAAMLAHKRLGAKVISVRPTEPVEKGVHY